MPNSPLICGLDNKLRYWSIIAEGTQSFVKFFSMAKRLQCKNIDEFKEKKSKEKRGKSGSCPPLQSAFHLYRCKIMKNQHSFSTTGILIDEQKFNGIFVFEKDQNSYIPHMEQYGIYSCRKKTQKSLKHIHIDESSGASMLFMLC